MSPSLFKQVLVSSFHMPSYGIVKIFKQVGFSNFRALSYGIVKNWYLNQFFFGINVVVQKDGNPVYFTQKLFLFGVLSPTDITWVLSLRRLLEYASPVINYFRPSNHTACTTLLHQRLGFMCNHLFILHKQYHGFRIRVFK